jgi:hypothetical protein
MRKHPKDLGRLVTQGSASPEDKEDLYEKYQRIQVYEHHFNNLQTEIRKLASVWLLVALGAIAYLIRGEYVGENDVTKLMIDPKLLISMVSLMGIVGLSILWVLDQMVYHRLLNATFLLGLRMEYRYTFLPPIRTLMVLLSRKRGMARFLRLFYLGPMLVLAIASSFWVGWYLSQSRPGGSPILVPLIIGIAALLIPAWVILKSAGMEKYHKIAEGFNDQDFVDYLREGKYEEVVQKH